MSADTSSQPITGPLDRPTLTQVARTALEDRQYQAMCDVMQRAAVQRELKRGMPKRTGRLGRDPS